MVVGGACAGTGVKKFPTLSPPPPPLGPIHSWHPGAEVEEDEEVSRPQKRGMSGTGFFYIFMAL